MQDNISITFRLQEIERSLKWLREDVHALMAVANAIKVGLQEALENDDYISEAEEDTETDEPPSNEWGSMTPTQSM